MEFLTLQAMEEEILVGGSWLDKYLELGFWHAFLVSLAVIIVSEIGGLCSE